MKVPERNLSKVKLDVFFNNDLWFRGVKKPPAKVKVKAIKENDLVKVNFVEIPERIKFLKQKLDRKNKLPEKKPEKIEEKKEVKPEQTEEKKTEEKEKERAVAEQRIQEAEQQAKVQKYTTKKKEPGFHRLALKK